MSIIATKYSRLVRSGLGALAVIGVGCSIYAVTTVRAAAPDVEISSDKFCHAFLMSGNTQFCDTDPAYNIYGTDYCFEPYDANKCN